jgi:GNAT superfamily N-acetyltransferase
MPAMTDPSDALPSFQGAYDAGLLQRELQPGLIDKTLHLHVDKPRGTPRFIYLRIESGVITAIAIIASAELVGDVPCLQIGYAVHEDYRGQGRAKALVKSAIAEFKNGFAGYPPIYLEAVIAKSNIPSMKVAETAFASAAEEITDVFSGVPALLYRDLITPPARRA